MCISLSSNSSRFNDSWMKELINTNSKIRIVHRARCLLFFVSKLGARATEMALSIATQALNQPLRYGKKCRVVSMMIQPACRTERSTYPLVWMRTRNQNFIVSMQIARRDVTGDASIYIPQSTRRASLFSKVKKARALSIVPATSMIIMKAATIFINIE
jgi:hypothetical protein